MDLNSALSAIQWSAPEVVKLRTGAHKMVQTAEIPEGFSDAWRANKDAIKAQGIGMYKDDATGSWSLKAWTDVGQPAKPHNGGAAAPPPAPAPSAPPEMAGFEAAAASVPNWPGHDYQAPQAQPTTPIGQDLNDAIPDFTGNTPTPSAPPVGTGDDLSAVVSAICGVYAQRMRNRDIMVALAKVAANYKGD